MVAEKKTGEDETPDYLDPEKVRAVDVEIKGTGEIIRRECYDPDGGPAEMGDVMRVEDGELWLRVISWARSRSPDAELKVQWESIGLSTEEVGRIGVFTWPIGEAVAIFGEKASDSSSDGTKGDT